MSTLTSVNTATSSNSARTITVTATDQGLPTALSFEASEYRRGATHLAAEIVRLAQRSTLLAKAERRQALAAAGMASVLLDRLGLPTPEAVAVGLARLDAAETTGTSVTSWVRAV
ncbi:hypothetical protein [Nocardia acidivorans]|uniref:hypothetical protein n=1 Tax=Nocardia acidivorans TaxID=404580 RepID=UPI000831AE77|nr:hypothetical protein [Nocardia acidivorans]